VISLWREGVARLQSLAESSSDQRAATFRSKVRYFQVAVEQGGQCCVQPASLRAQ